MNNGFVLSQNSLDNLEGVHEDLVRVVKRAIDITEVDFGVSEGLRTLEEQKEMVRTGASDTMNSRHLTGHAVDLMAYVGARVSWEWPLYHKILDAMKQAAEELNVEIRWGGCWKNLKEIEDSEYEVDAYAERKRKQGKKPLLDGPHYELDWNFYKA